MTEFYMRAAPGYGVFMLLIQFLSLTSIQILITLSLTLLQFLLFLSLTLLHEDNVR